MKSFSVKCEGCGRQMVIMADHPDDAAAKWDLFKPCGCNAVVSVAKDRWTEEQIDDIGEVNT